MVVDAVIATAPLALCPNGAIARAFKDSLALSNLPAFDLLALYDGWRTRIKALATAR